MPKVSNLTIPRGAQIHPALHLFSWRPSGVLNAALATEILRFIELEEENAEEPFDRFANLSDIEAVHLSFADVEKIADRRVIGYHGARVKTAILALNPLAFGMARMYGQLMRRTPIEVRVFCRIGATATWLNVPFGVLEKI